MRKRIFAVLILAFLLAGCAGPAHAPAQDAPETTEQPTPEAPAASAQPTAEPEKPDYEPELDSVPNAVDLYFPSNPSTGYVWTAEIEDPAVAELDEMFFDGGMPGLVGAGGTQWYRIRGKAEGITSVTFRYARPWEDSALTTYLYRLQVDERGSVLIWGVEVNGA